MAANAVPDVVVVDVLRRRPRRCTILDGRRTTGGRLTASADFYSGRVAALSPLSLSLHHPPSLSLPFSPSLGLYKGLSDARILSFVECSSTFLLGDFLIDQVGSE